MARRNIFQPPPPPDADAPATPMPQRRFPKTGAMSGVQSTLRDVASNAVREISVEMIEESGHRDRLAFTDEDVAKLAKSIENYGQQVPIMVRPITERPGYYRIVYGRRRLLALQSLGIPAKALVRSLTDEEAVLAQGQENTQRLDPSFIEKALFASQLAEDGYETEIILDSLALNRPSLSRMNMVIKNIPRSVIEQIGSAHDVGRRPWRNLADQVSDNGIDIEEIVEGLDLESIKDSNKRFDLVHKAVTEAASKENDRSLDADPDALENPLERQSDEPEVKSRPASPALSFRFGGGAGYAEVKETPGVLTLRLSKSDAPEFAQWIRKNAEAELTRLYEAWQSELKSD